LSILMPMACCLSLHAAWQLFKFKHRRTVLHCITTNMTYRHLQQVHPAQLLQHCMMTCVPGQHTLLGDNQQVIVVA